MGINAHRKRRQDAPDLAGAVAAAEAWGYELKSAEELDRLDRDERLNDVMEILGRLPDAFRDAKLAHLLSRIQHAQLKLAAQRWTPEEGGLLLLGPTGAGKSMAAAYIFRRLAKKGVIEGGAAWGYAKRLRWFSAVELEQARRQHPLGQGEAPEIVVASRAPFVVIDDVGWDKDPVAVSTVLDARYGLCLPTVVTTGMTEATLAVHYGPAVVRRISESGGKRGRVIDAHGSAGTA